MNNMEHLIERLTDSVATAEQYGEDMNAVDWGWQVGTLISHNEAKSIIEALKTAKLILDSKPINHEKA